MVEVWVNSVVLVVIGKEKRGWFSLGLVCLWSSGSPSECGAEDGCILAVLIS